jgi:uncharacterized protein
VTPEPPGPASTTGTRASRLVLYLAGCVVFAFGATLFIVARQGSDPLDVFVLGLREHLPITIGLGQGGVAIACVLAWAAWNRRRPQLLPMVTFFLCGSLIDGMLYIHVAGGWPVAPVFVVALAGILCAIGSACIILSGLGIRAMDLLALTMRARWRWPLWCAKGALEMALLAVGAVLGGPVGYGTVYFLVVVGLLLQPCIALLERACKVPNHGFALHAPRSTRSADVAA